MVWRRHTDCPVQHCGPSEEVSDRGTGRADSRVRRPPGSPERVSPHEMDALCRSYLLGPAAATAFVEWGRPEATAEGGNEYSKATMIISRRNPPEAAPCDAYCDCDSSCNGSVLGRRSRARAAAPWLA